MNPGSEFSERFLFPEPRVLLGQELRALASAMIDISDGLASDLGSLLHASGCGATVDVANLPIADSIAQQLSAKEAINLALAGGEDYELCFCVPPEHARRVNQLAKKLQIPVTEIGAVKINSEYLWVMNDAEFVPDQTEFRHFD